MSMEHKPLRVVVIGYGMAAARFAEEVRKRDPDGERIALTIVGEESQPAYNRVLLPTAINATMDDTSLLLQDEHWAGEHKIDLRLAVGATSIDRSERRVEFDDGTSMTYDRLVLATGARAVVPEVAGLVDEDGNLAEGVTEFRSLEDCKRMIAEVEPEQSIAVLGGGVLGLEVASGLISRGCRVTVVHHRPTVMDRQLDAGASRVLHRTLEANGMQIRAGSAATRYLPGRGLVLDDGECLAASMLVVTTGARPRTELAERAGLNVDSGVVVGDNLRTSDRWIYAIGDCARHPTAAPGLVTSAFDQAAVLADRITNDDDDADYGGTGAVTRLKARGVELAALGEVHVDVDDEDAEVVRIEDPTRGQYAKLVVRDDRVAGAILLGAPDAAATITQLYDQGSPVPTQRVPLLLGRALPEEGSPGSSPADAPDDTTICRCNTVSKGDVVSAFQDGAEDVQAVASATKATTGCGSCRGAVEGILDWLRTDDES